MQNSAAPDAMRHSDTDEDAVRLLVEQLKRPDVDLLVARTWGIDIEGRDSSTRSYISR
jgi:hypothetical protein